MSHLHIAAAITVTTVVSACGSTEPEFCQPETQVLEVTTEIGENVVFDWTPECGVRNLFLEQDFPPNNDVWQIEGEANVIMPPVTYGTVPPGAQLSGGEATPLIVGQSYLVGLFRALPTGETCNDAGSTAFCRVSNFTFTR